MCIFTLHIFSGPGDVREKRRLGRSDFNSRFDRNRFIFFFLCALYIHTHCCRRMQITHAVDTLSRGGFSMKILRTYTYTKPVWSGLVAAAIL